MKKETDPIRKQLDELLARLRARQAEIAAVHKEMSTEIDAVTAKYNHLLEAKLAIMQADETELIALAKYHKATLFAATDRVDVANGAVLRQVARKVKRIKGMLAKLKTAGHDEAIKTVESVDWDTIEKWSDDILKELGTKRVPKEIFAYEVKGV